VDDRAGGLRAREFETLVEMALPNLLEVETIEREPNLDGGRGPDFLARLRDGQVALVEVKTVTPATATRVRQTAARLVEYGEAYARGQAENQRPPQLVLVTSGVLAPERISQLMEAGITRVFDGPGLVAAAPQLPWTRIDVRERANPDVPPNLYVELARTLRQISPGKPGWAGYQRTVRDILAAVWCPPLEQPLSEHPNATGVNRRDIIFPNYAGEGVWKFLRDHYEAHYIVVDAKNYVKGVKKDEVLQIANYLGNHGAGLFGVIVCRNGPSVSAEITRREQWIIHRKLIVFLVDDDLDQMMSFAIDGTDPAIVVRQKIEDFRLGI